MVLNIHTLPENSEKDKKNKMFSLLRSQGGYSLAEVLVAAIVMAVMIITVYIGIIYADRQITKNYRHRVATLLLTGELEKQYTLFHKEGIFHPYTNLPVIIEQTDDVTVNGTITITVGRERENYMSQNYNFSYLIGEIKWIDPATEKLHYIRMREDFYD
ncbi:MAG: hypothetical protein KA963_01710 [Candidatus Cloacimonas sp.]|jgi:hypothetical protein|nr:hypothetical protein [Candidatus Cloacimonas sp.]HNX03792.1 hypothetical protein [Candidatus Cloacimonas sp.]HPS61033.1 hypothetical protein [Candidatus Cloacimonas sp.]